MRITRHLLLRLFAVGVTLLFLVTTVTLGDEASRPVVTVIHIDAAPEFTQSAITLLTGFRRDSLRDPGAKTFQVLQELDRANHFTLVEEWRTQKDYENHNLEAHTRHFRDQLQPMLASPFDERVHTDLIAAP